MRTINANALTYVNEQYGSEPANIVEFEFGTYCDKDTEHVAGKILELSMLDAIINVSSSSDSQEITVILDDTDNTIKEYMNTHDVHLTEATVYQWFDGLDFDDRFILFQGQVNTPILWNEGKRTVTLTIISKLEDVEIGFSPEEGQFTKLGNDYAGKPWPMCFGTVTAAKALRLNDRYRGMTSDGFGIPDEHLYIRGQILQWFSTHIGFTFTPDEYNQPLQAALKCFATYNEQKETIRHGVTVFNGDKFPRGEITLDFGKVRYSGHFEDNYFVFHGLLTDPCDGKEPIEVQDFGLALTGLGGGWGGGGSLTTASGNIRGENCGYIYVSPGTTVRLYSSEPIYYAVSCVPGTILKVSSHVEKHGDKYLQDVPSNMWTQENWNLGNGLTGVILKISDALSKKIAEDNEASWSDDVYVTFQSTIGPNTADILYYLTNTYAQKGIVNYSTVRTKIVNYPSDFAIYDRPNIIDALQNIAWQARCSIYYKNGSFYLNYLPETHTPVDTITVNDIIEDTLIIEYTDTEDIITKMDCLWKESAIQEEDNKIILRNNISKYGTKDKEYDFYIYNYVDAVLKSGTYWMVKYSNTWKRVKFETPITKLALETLDYITLDLDALADSPILCSIEEVTYNSENNSLVFTCFAPVKAGQMEQYIYAYPANLSVSLTYPSEDEFDIWQSSDAINKLTSGNLSITSYTYYGTMFPRANPDPYNNRGPTNTQFTINGFSDIDRRWADRGSLYVSDVGDNYPGGTILKSTPYLYDPNPGPNSIMDGEANFVAGEC